MAGHDLIDGYLTTLAARLPADAVDELADGLTETYRRHLSTGVAARAAAAATVAEFGTPEVVVAAFVRQAPGRRLARLLLCWVPRSGCAGVAHWCSATGRYRRRSGWRSACPCWP